MTLRPSVLAVLALVALALSGWPASRARAATTLELPGDRPVILGETGSVVLSLRVDEPADLEDRPIRLATNVGSFGEISRKGPGQYSVVYVPPATRFPQVALVAVWRETGPEAPIDFVRLPLLGRTKLPVGAAKGTQLRVQVGAAEFGPVVAESAKPTEVSLAVPPGVREATVLARSPTGATSTRTVAVSTPAYNRLTTALTPHAIAGDLKGWARLEVYYDAQGTEPPPPSEIKVVPSAGTVSLLKADRGRYTYRYLPPPPSPATVVDFSVTVNGDPSARAQSRLSLRLPPPARLVLRPPKSPLPCDGSSSAAVELSVLDGEGLGLPGLALKVTGDGTALPVRDLGNGRYQATFTAPAAYPPGGLVHFEASVPGAGGQSVLAEANYQLEAAPRPASASLELSPSPVPADGHSVALLTLLVRDDAGQPARNQRLIAVASDGTLDELQEVEAGRYVAHYTAPARLPPGDATLRVVDATGAFEHKGVLPLREPPGHLLLGVRAGFFYDFAHQYGPRGGLDLYVPLRAGSLGLGVGLSGTYGQARQTVSAEGGLKSESIAHLVPVTLKLGAEVYAGRRLSLTLGAGGVLVWAQMSTSLTKERAEAWAGGAMGFASLGVAAGPGQLFVDLSYAWAPVQTADFRLDAGGLGLELGYRLGVF